MTWKGKRLTHTADAGLETWTGGDGRPGTPAFIVSWGILAGAARAALPMIPTSEEGRARQAPLLHELEQAADQTGRAAAPDQAIMAARDLVETTLVGLREPAGARPYDAERAHRLRRRVLTFVTVAAGQVAGVDLPDGADERSAVFGALRAGRLARSLLDDPTMAPP